MSLVNTDRLRAIKTLPSLVAYLRDELDWPIEAGDAEDITFDYDPSELGIDAKSAVRIKEIKQLRPLAANQPWGIFFVNFEKKRLPVVVMRMILRSLVFKKRAAASAAERQAWQPSDLLFISAYGEETDRAITFAHFVENPGTHLAELRVLGWDDDDTPLKMDYVARILHDKLTWDAKLTKDPEAWRARWSDAFLIRHRFVITKSDQLAAALAVLARRLRTRIRTFLRSEDGFGEIRKLQRAFREGLIHDLDDDAFADMFAQTVTYGLFSVSVRRTFPGEGTAVIKDDVPNLIFTSPFLKEMLGTFLGIRSRKGAIDFDELGVSDVTDLLTSPDTHMEVVLADFNNKTPGEDPVIHFYQDFLNSYNKQLRIQRGVFYTPQPVVSYIVRSVHELLQSEFGLTDGLADTTTWGEFIQKSKINNPQSEIKLPSLTDLPGEKQTISPDEPFVQILDPATGTATFLVEVIDVIHKHLEAKWKSGGEAAMPRHSSFIIHPSSFAAFWNDYVPKALLPRLHAYELMMAPYAIAHMKVGLKLAETGYKFATEEPARIYLTNALEPWVKQLPLIGFDALAHEAAAVNEIKRHKRFTVVIGNPPYSGEGMNKGDWIRSLIETYMYVDGSHLGEKGKKNWLQDDYVKFIRYAQFELDKTKLGVLGFVTNHSFLDNPTFRGMRASLRNSFPQIHVLDLHGNSKKLERGPDDTADENVFDIQQGVSIGLFRRAPGIANSKAVAHSQLWGLRGDASKTTHGGKYGWLSRSSKTSTDWHELSPNAPFHLFVPQDIDLRSEYDEYWKLTDVMPHYGAGIITSRDHFVIDFEDAPLLKRLEVFRDMSVSDEWVRSHFEIKDNSMWRMDEARKAFQKKPIQSELFVDVLYRPYDRRRIYFETNVVFNMRIQIMRHLLRKDNLALITTRQTKEPWSVLVSRDVVAHKATALYDVSSVFPLLLQDEDTRLSFDKKHRPNFSPLLIPALRKQLGSAAAGLTPEDIFHYAYAVFHSPGYRSRYAEFLKIDFPRLPLTGNLELFRALARLGGELTALHLLESPKLATVAAVYDRRWNAWRFDGGDKTSDAHRAPLQFIGPEAPLVTKPGWADGTVWLDSGGKKATTTAGTSGFRGVPEHVWNFHIGGYQVCEKWLKDRKGRTLTAEDLAHYQKIVIALTETIRLMAEIDEVIETHGGWPGAFQAATGSEIIPPENAPAQAPTGNPMKPPASSGGAWIPGELFSVEGELKPAKKAKAAPKAAKTPTTAKRKAPQPDSTADKSDLMAIFREVLAKRGACDRETLIQHAAHALGYRRPDQTLSEKLDNAIRTAKRRGILYNEQGKLHLDRTPLNQWDRAILKVQFLAALNQHGRVWIERDEAIRAFARWLGFRRTGPIIDQTARSLINSLLRNRSIEKDGQQYIRRI